MKVENIAFIALFCAALFTMNASFFLAGFTIGKVSAPAPVVREPEDIINLMISCESSGNPHAYNPRDVDGEPRYGLLQFSKATWREQERLYRLHGDIWSGDDQIELALLMIRDGKAGRWGCFYKINTP